MYKLVFSLPREGKVLVIVTQEQILLPQQVCKGCLMATVEGLPRWRGGELMCGKHLGKSHHSQLALYKCQMGFSLVNVN